MKKLVSCFLFLALLAMGCAGAVAESAGTAAVCIPTSSDEFFLGIADQVTATLEAAGYEVQMADANSDTQAMIRQIQNFTALQVDFMYVFPAGDAAAFKDVMTEATNSGIKTLVSHNNTGEGSAVCTVQCDEFIMGCMMAPLVSTWVDAHYPDAADGEVKMLVLEQSLIPDMVKRSTGMKLIGEKFLRKVDLATGTFVKEDGEAVTYVDENGTEQAVEEPTGGLVLDENGHAILNPFYDARVTVVTTSDRMIQTNMDAQNAIDVVMAGADGSQIKIVACYSGDAAVGASEKLISLNEQGYLPGDLGGYACFGADITDANIERMNASADNTSLLRGVMTNGNIVQTIVDMTSKMIAGEEVPTETWEELGYMYYDQESGELVQVTYAGQLPDTALFFG